MDSIDPNALYDERGDVSWARPLLQGDVFEEVILPGFGDEPRTVQIVTHPCAMRKGPVVLPRVTVAPVEPHQALSGEADWEGHLRVMPLPDLRDGRNFATKFVDVTAAPSELLTLDRRIATLSNRGIYVLQQRLVKHYTRFDASLGLLRRESAPILEEAQQQWDWIETALTPDELRDPAAIAAEEVHFDAWLNGGEPSRRALLQDEVHHADIRRQTLRAAEERSRARQEEARST